MNVTDARLSRRLAQAAALGCAVFLALPAGAAIAEPADPPSPPTEETVAPPAPATLTLEPSSGSPGDRVSVIGREFFCDNDSRQVELVWDNGPLVADTFTDELGEFRGTVLVPPDAALGGRVVTASCTEGPITETATFTVVTRPTTAAEITPPVIELPATEPPVIDPPVVEPPAIEPPPGFPLRTFALIFTAALAALAYRGWRQHRAYPTDVRVHTAFGPSAAPTMTVRETPAPGQRSLAIRLQAHADSGTQTIEETDDEYTRS